MAQSNAIPMAPESFDVPTWQKVARWCAVILLSGGLLFLSTLMYQSGDVIFAVGMITLAGVIAFVYLNPNIYVARYLIPGFAFIALFSVFPLVYTIMLSFTNYSSSNLLNYERAKSVLMSRTFLEEGSSHPFEIHAADGGQFRLVIERGNQFYASEPVRLSEGQEAGSQRVQMEPINYSELGTEPAALREVLANRAGLQALSAEIDGYSPMSYSGPRAFGTLRSLYVPVEGDSERLVNQRTNMVIEPDFSRGFFYQVTPQRDDILHDFSILADVRDNQASTENLRVLTQVNRSDLQANFRDYQAELERGLREYRVVPGFQVNTGMANYKRIFLEDGMLKPFMKIFTWTVIFSSFTVFATYLLGLVLACLLNWKLVKGTTLYRVLMILPYAVPAFISIQIFKGLFNQNFGEINIILEALFGIKPTWFTDPVLAKVMILITNLWLGYPYMMILGLGMLQSISDDLYEAATLEGSGVINNFVKITLPLVSKPMIPLLISAFAFNFNNYLLIRLLTNGGPNIIGANPLAGETDLLISYAFRLAFGDAQNEYALGAAIGGLIFLLIAALSMFYIRYAKVDVAR
ncbi:maltose ABC transporter permease MalF [Salinispirillum sp. LH 10-3-1]|uniref:Maltose/maltodextrin transport system permease protein n=1 Tax=Salinispirillum sp. LH 10-3-1 TaxID=2952525 RepID=A0AB38YGZ4_9GAMM